MGPALGLSSVEIGDITSIHRVLIHCIHTPWHVNKIGFAFIQRQNSDFIFVSAIDPGTVMEAE